MSRSELNIGRNVMIKLFDHDKKMADLAVALSCSPSLITKVICGEKIPSLKVAIGIADFFGCTVDELLKEEVK